MTRPTTDAVLERARQEHAATNKASADPGTLTDDDLLHLPYDQLTELMRDGKLTHLGYGGARRP